MDTKTFVMRKLVATLLCLSLFTSVCIAQYSENKSSSVKNKNNNNRAKIGIKAGYNWSYITASNTAINFNNTSGYMFGAFLAPPSKSFFGYRTEIIYTHQGYSFADGVSTKVSNNYIYLPQLTTFSIGKFFQLQVGFQAGILLNAKASTNDKDSSITDLMNRYQYGIAGGIELNPIAGLIIGGRYNIDLGNMYKNYNVNTMSAPPPSPLPFDPSTVNLKSGTIQIFVGYKF